MIGRLGARICDGISKSSWKCSRWNINTRQRVCKFCFLFSLAKLRITTIIDGGRGEGEWGRMRHDDELVAGMNQMNKYASQLKSCFAIWSWACSMVRMTQIFQEFVIIKMCCCPINAAVWRQTTAAAGRKFLTLSDRHPFNLSPDLSLMKLFPAAILAYVHQTQ